MVIMMQQIHMKILSGKICLLKLVYIFFDNYAALAGQYNFIVFMV